MTTQTNPYAPRPLETAANPYAAPTAAISAGPAPGGELAERAQRLRAAVIDYLVYLIAFGAGGITFAVTRRAPPAFALGSLVYVGLIVWNAVLLARHGQTVGKKVVGIRIVRSDGSDATFARLFWLRAVLVWVISALPTVGTLFWLVDCLFIFRNDRRCLHDLMADTIVVEAD